MQLVKNVMKKEVEFICDDIQAKYIHPQWMDIKDDYNKNIGIITGYQLNIPLIISDMFTERNSLRELDAVSQLCSELWWFLFEHKDELKEVSGEFYFLNNFRLDEGDLDTEKIVLNLLKDKYNVIIYSFGNTEIFDEYAICLSEEWKLKHIQILLQTGWSKENKMKYYIYANPKVIFRNPFSWSSTELL